MEALGIKVANDLPEWAAEELYDFRYSTFAGEFELWLFMGYIGDRLRTESVND